MYEVLADTIVAIHLVYIAFVVVGLLLIVVGALCRWQWVRNPWFRAVHLLMILVVAFEAMVEFECPLTTWENQLRALAGEHPDLEQPFTSRLMAMVLHPTWATQEILEYWVYGLSLLILASFIAAPPRLRRRPRLPAPANVKIVTAEPAETARTNPEFFTAAHAENAENNRQ